jgi:hypothetical protein
MSEEESGVHELSARHGHLHGHEGSYLGEAEGDRRLDSCPGSSEDSFCIVVGGLMVNCSCIRRVEWTMSLPQCRRCGFAADIPIWSRSS